MPAMHVSAVQGGGWQRYAHLLVVYLVWGSTYFAVKIAVGGDTTVSPLQMQTWRMWCAGLLLVVVAMAGTRQLPRIRLAHLALCVASGILMWVLGNGLATLASRHATSAFIVMAMGMIPLWTTLMSSIMARQMPSRRTGVGLLVGLAGLLLIFGQPLLQSGSSAVEVGYGLWITVLLVGAGLTWSLGTILQRPLLDAVSPAWASGLQMLAAAIVLTAIAWGSDTDLHVPANVTLNQIAAFVFLVVFGSAICLMSYLRVLKAFSPSVASTFAYVNPVVGLALGWSVLGERPSTWALGGMALVLCGVFTVLSAASR